MKNMNEIPPVVLVLGVVIVGWVLVSLFSPIMLMGLLTTAYIWSSSFRNSVNGFFMNLLGRFGITAPSSSPLSSGGGLFPAGIPQTVLGKMMGKKNFNYKTSSPRPKAKRPPKMDADQAFKIMGLTNPSSRVQINERFKSLGDRYQSSTDKKDEEKYMELCLAYEYLMKAGYLKQTAVDDAFKSLGLKNDADPKTIKERYFKLSKKYHPDNDTTGDRDKFMEINEAHDVLCEEGFVK